MEAAKSIADCGLRIADWTKGGNGGHFSLLSLFSPVDSSYSGCLPAVLSSAGLAKEGARYSSHLSHSSCLRMGCGGARRDFCVFLRPYFSNLYQISRHFHDPQSSLTAHFLPICVKLSQVPFNKQLTTYLACFQSNPVKPGKTKSK
jgi:hypothetical protein